MTMMKADIISFGWGEEYVVPNTFDLNTLRSFAKVKEVNRNYIPDEEASGITIKLNKNIALSKADQDENLIAEATEKASQYERWYREEQEKNRKLTGELNSLKEVA